MKPKVSQTALAGMRPYQCLICGSTIHLKPGRGTAYLFVPCSECVKNLGPWTRRPSEGYQYGRIGIMLPVLDLTESVVRRGASYDVTGELRAMPPDELPGEGR